MVYMKSEQQKKKTEKKDFLFIIFVIVFGIIFISVAVFIFVMPQPLVCGVLSGCQPEYWGLGFLVCIFGVILLGGGILGVLMRMKRQ